MLPKKKKRVALVMDHNNPLSQRPKKKRRTGRGVFQIQEGDDITADGIMVLPNVVETAQGPLQIDHKEPVWLNKCAAGAVLASESGPVATSTSVENEPAGPHIDDYADLHEEAPSPRNRKTQQYYLEQFVQRVHPMLDALLSREAVTHDGECPNCESGQVSRWRCKDCTSSRLLCRGCMRHTHRDNPLHRIEVWMGKFFRAAALWEVGEYLLIPHHTGNALCNTLVREIALLERFQERRDASDAPMAQGNVRQHNGGQPADSQPAADQPADDINQDAKFMQALDDMYQSDGQLQTEEQDGLEADDQGEMEEDDLTVPAGYLPDRNLDGRPYRESGEIPLADALAHSFVRVVHTNGIHHIALVCCGCRGEDTTHADLMAARFVPTSFVRYRTLFTHQVLDDFRLANLECKASAYQYFQKLRRHTSAMAPESVPNLYHELRRMSRIWRWMKKLKWAGFAHESRGHMDVAPGSLANFCPACPQPEVNLPKHWDLDPHKWVYKRSFVADGNFKADHVRQKNTDIDVWLSEGGGMMSKREDYVDFLRNAVERVTVRGTTRGRIRKFTILFSQKAPCQNHFRAIEMSMLQSKACDITGIVAIACARHGCFAPNAVANLFRGEQQKNVDWALLQACQTTHLDPRQGLLLIYDIACQYVIHLQDRIGHLLPPNLSLDAAIGLFHVHGHQDTCFFRYATSFIPGAAVVAGEILESLWAVLNAVTPAMRTATLAHRAEIMDDHMTDSNHKKCLGMGESIVLLNDPGPTLRCSDYPV